MRSALKPPALMTPVVVVVVEGDMVLDGIGSTAPLAATHRTTRLASGE